VVRSRTGTEGDPKFSTYVLDNEGTVYDLGLGERMPDRKRKDGSPLLAKMLGRRRFLLTLKADASSL